MITRFLISFLAATATSTAATPPTPKVTSISYSGNGCPQGGVAVSLATLNGTSLLTIFDGTSLRPVIGPSTGAMDRRKTCYIVARIDIDRGWKLRINNRGTDVKGYMPLPEDISYEFMAEYSDDRQLGYSVS